MLDRELEDFDQMFDDLPIKPVIANDLDIVSDEGKQQLNQLLLTKYEGDSLSNIPSCRRGCLTGLEHLHKVCEICGDICETMLNRPIYPMVWMAAPEGTACLLNPAAYYPLKKTMTVEGCSDLEWLIDPLYEPPKLSVRCKRLAQQGVQRGLGYFHANFESIMILYVEAWRIRKRNYDKEDFEAYVNMLIKNPQWLFCQYLPMPSRVGFVLETNESGAYLEKNVASATNALLTIVSIKNAVRPMTIPHKEHRIVKAMNILTPFFHDYTATILGKKPGLLRKNIIAGKVNFTGRAVITSIHGIHRYDELHYSWSLSVSLFRPHLMNKLLKRGFTPNEIKSTLRFAAKNECPLISELFDEMLLEASEEGGIQVHKDDLAFDGMEWDDNIQGIGTVLQRNPSLKRLSMQYFYVSRIDRNPRVNVVRISVLAIKGMN